MNPTRLAFLSALLSAAFGYAGTAEVAAPTAQGGANSYTLFRGASLSVGMNGAVYPVWDVSGGSWVFRAKGQPVVVSAKDGPVNLKVDSGLRLTESSATIANLKAEPAYTPGHDPYTRFTRQMSKAASDFAEDQFAVNEANHLMDQATVLVEQSNAGSSGASGTIPSGALSNSSSAGIAQNAMINATNRVNSANTATGAFPGIPLGAKTAFDPSGESYDAMEVTFDVSAARPLNRPFVVIIGQFRGRGDPAGAYRKWVYAEALERIDSNVTKVHFLKGGFPPGFQLKDLQLHVYNEGEEVATNVAKDRVPMTRAEAFDYVKSHYIGSHKGSTLPSVPALGRLPADLPSRLSRGQYGQVLYVKVSKDGIAEDVFLDPACSRRAQDPYVESVAKGLLFEPALEDGTPVEGVATLNLSQLAM